MQLVEAILDSKMSAIRMVIKLLFWTSQTALKITSSLFHNLLALKYWGKRKTVPKVTNPLLLKSATQLAKEIREENIKCVEVIRAYIERIQEVEPYINAMTENRFEMALNEAKEVDALIGSGKYTRDELANDKPLLGVPITVKLLLTVKGLKCTGGCLLLKDLVASEDSPCVSLMRKAGAIVLGTTNIAEMGMEMESNNNLYGKTCNPYDNSRTSGGSSGGESALIGAAGSVLGLGNDLLGSIRMPAHFTGIFGHKATVGLVPNEGCFPRPDPLIEKYLYTGPMCRYAEDLVTSMKVLTSAQVQKSLKFGKKVDFGKLKICYLLEIRSILVANVDKEIELALRKAVSHFEEAYDITAREVKMPSLYDINRCVFCNVISTTKGLKDRMTVGRGKNLNLTLELLKYFVGKSTLSRGPVLCMNFAKCPLWYSKQKLTHYQEMIKRIEIEFDNLLDENTVLLMPTLPMVAPFHSETIFYLPSMCFSSMFNCLGLPVTQCPLGYNHEGLPYGIQIIGRKNNDDLTIACAVELEKAFGGWKPPGSTP